MREILLDRKGVGRRVGKLSRDFSEINTSELDASKTRAYELESKIDWLSPWSDPRIILDDWESSGVS